LTLRAVAKIGRVLGEPAGGGGGESAVFYDFAPACAGNTARDGDVVCAPALVRCRRVDPSALLYYVFRGTEPERLANVGTVCLGDGDFVERARLDRDVAALVRRLPLRAPAVRSAPAGVTLVRLPTVVWAVDAATGALPAPTRRVSASIDGVGVTLTVRGAWTWHLGDGSPPRTLTGPGVPYARGVSPDPRVDPGYYTAHDGRAGSGLLASYRVTGTYRVAVTVRWVPSYRVDYQVGTRELDTAAVAYTTVRPLRVGEARAVLVAGD
jgi:hypothetical protein